MTTYLVTPHPDYPAHAYTTAEVQRAVHAEIGVAENPADAVHRIMRVLDAAGYDSIDRELAFWDASESRQWDYNNLYDAWMAPAVARAQKGGMP